MNHVLPAVGLAIVLLFFTPLRASDMNRCRVGSVRALSLKLSFGGPAGVRLIVSWWQPKWQCPSDLLSGIFAVPAKREVTIDEFCLNTHLVYFSRHGVLDIVIARILYMIASFLSPRADRDI